MPPLFKFIASPDAVPFLLNGSVKFTPIPELNDPSELVPTLDREAVVETLNRLRADGYSDADMEHLRQQGNLLQALAPKFQAITAPATKAEASRLIRSWFYDDISTLDRLLSETAREISSKVGLFCLTQRFDSLPMWAHYAANATGLAVEFQGLEEVFKGDNTGVLRQLAPVIYQREPYGVTFDPASHRNLFFVKFLDWSYEQEVRVVLPLSECRSHNTGDKVLYTHNIPRQSIARLILGWNMKAEDVSTVETLVDQIDPEVAVSRARFVRGKVSLEPLPRTAA